ncbi:MAG: hypothetical protein H6Q03_1464 [Acidobacteria bacterium]|jgi:hypothetical protein|nr:hypothetical protein [Acidobacteriota bacterium]
MFVGYGVLDLHLPHARDLKSKRRVVKGLVDRLHARFRVSVAETGAQDLWQRAEVGVAVVGRDASEVERALDQVLALAEQEPEAMILAWEPRIVEGDE